jgi:TetR/AcrR family transcriptional regulator, ethionamide resistance regulator
VDARGTREASVERQIIEATETLLEDLPYRDLTVDAVIETAGVSEATFNRHFTDLESVLLRGLAEVSDGLHQAAGKFLDPSSDPEEAIAFAGIELIAVWQQHGPLIRAFAEAAVYGPALDGAWHDVVRGFEVPLAARIDELNRTGRASVPYPYETARAISWMIASYMLETFGHTSDVTPEMAFGAVGTIIYRAIFTMAPSPSELPED